MPPRRRQNKRRERIDPQAFLHSDGVRPFFDGDQTFETPFLARAAWEQVRAETWAIEYRGIYPPGGAVAYDGITEHTSHLRPCETSWSIEATREAVGADSASVEAFRHTEPTKAASVTDELDQYVEDLRVLLDLAEQLHDQRDELGNRHVLQESWASLEMRRRYSS